MFVSIVTSAALLGSVPAAAQSCVMGEEALGWARPPSNFSLASKTHPIRVHWSEPEDEGKAELVRDWAELSWDIQVGQLGSRPPVLPDALDGPELDFYLVLTSSGGGWAFADNFVDTETGDGYNSTSAYILIDRRTPDSWMASLVSHEFQHACQFATDFSERSLPIWESVATAAQAWTLPPEETDFWTYDVSRFQSAPWMPTLLGDGSAWYTYGVGWNFEYGGALWVMYLDEIAGSGEGLAGAQLWEATANEGRGLEPDPVDAFAEVAGLPLGEALNELARTRWLVGEDWDSRGIAAAASWDERFLVPATLVDITSTPVQLSPALTVTGQGFVELDGWKELDGDELVVRVTSNQGLDSALLVLWWGIDGSVGEGSAEGAEPSVSIDTAGLETIVVAVTNLGVVGFDPDLDDPWAFGDQLLLFEHITDSTSADTGRPRGEDSAAPQRDIGAPPKGCGCTGAPAPVGWLAPLLAMLVVARRYRTGDVGDVSESVTQCL